MKPFIVIIQGRMSSKRYPGKILYLINGKPVLLHIIESLLNCCKENEIIVSTSNEESDNAVEEFCNTHNFQCVRGSLNDVSKRFIKVLELYPAKVFARISGDSPLFDYRILELAKTGWNDKYDLVSTVGSQYPSGMNVELVKSKTFSDSYKKFDSYEDYEHVTPYFYKNKKKFNISTIATTIKDSDKIKFSFDSNQDRLVIDEIFSKMTKPHYSYLLSEKIEIYNSIIGKYQ